jgi:hypothetical protein
MSRRTTSDYKSVFEFLKKKIGKCAVKEIVSDFEKGILNGLRLVFKKVSFHGCAFHWTQALFRRLLKYEGLSKLYLSRTKIQQLCRKMMSLHLLRHSKIRKAFIMLSREMKKLENQQLNKWCNYIEKQWINFSFYPPKLWSVYMQSVRSNNHAEGWHRRINEDGHASMNFYDLVPLLYSEAQLIPLKRQWLSKKKMLTKSRRHELNYDLFKLWRCYNSK